MERAEQIFCALPSWNINVSNSHREAIVVGWQDDAVDVREAGANGSNLSLVHGPGQVGDNNLMLSLFPMILISTILVTADAAFLVMAPWLPVVQLVIRPPVTQFGSIGLAHEGLELLVNHTIADFIAFAEFATAARRRAR